MTILKGTFTSVWDGGVEITTNATLDTDSGYVDAESVYADVDILEKEYFTDEDGDEYEICPDCHEFIMRSVMVSGIGKCYDEVFQCSNPDCDNYV